MADPTDSASWELIEAQLPSGWHELASEMGLIRKLPEHIGQKANDIGIALRLVVHYATQRGSIRLTTAAAAVAGIVSSSQPALFTWMFKAGAVPRSACGSDGRAGTLCFRELGELRADCRRRDDRDASRSEGNDATNP